MKTSRTHPLAAGFGLAAFTFLTTPASAAEGAAASVPHVGDRYKARSFDLHAELTQAEFDDFTLELGAILRPRQFGDASTLGKGRIEIGMPLLRTGIDDAKGAWNNTTTRPISDRGFGDSVASPRLSARVGVSDRVDIGVSGGAAFRSNYGYAGVDAKIAVVRQGPGRPVSVAIRPAVAALIGPKEVWVGAASLDVSVSRALGAWSPYGGWSSVASFGTERSREVSLEDALVTESILYGGVQYRFRSLTVAAEAERGRLTTYGLQVSGRF